MKPLRPRTVGVVVCACVALLGAACSSIKVQHVSDPAADMGALKTFVIEPNNQQVSSDRMLMGLPLRDAIAQSIAKELEGRGKTAAPAGQAQMIVHWVANIQYTNGVADTGPTRIDLRQAFAAQDYVYAADDSGSMPYLVTNGSVAVDIQDAQTKKSVWRGLISGVMKEKVGDPERQERLDGALEKLFESIPKG